jgi:hypothetical protein
MVSDMGDALSLIERSLHCILLRQVFSSPQRILPFKFLSKKSLQTEKAPIQNRTKPPLKESTESEDSIMTLGDRFQPLDQAGGMSFETSLH